MKAQKRLGQRAFQPLNSVEYQISVPDPKMSLLPFINLEIYLYIALLGAGNQSFHVKENVDGVTADKESLNWSIDLFKLAC